ncbi:uncharacterized protein BX664DRAFT_325210 [Halteromyces radiatus]|uniref:uncharacterized protein n=1 Tax=Halteromyces radiatus TaxID=101107 RepID=UPI00221F0DD2|nr:uncharacterized protein BX664DRAFT_325210 [Halteromyces radiatus]KAI8096929.1 hypothetical protein BX664DRAFT_325210 [Halteromyces radiatus]
MEEKINLTVYLSILKQPLFISITHSDSFQTLAEELCQQYHLPPYYTIPLLSSITSAYTQALLVNTPSSTSPISSNARQRFTHAYQTNTLQYYNKDEEDVFPRAFYTLVKCPISSIFDALLELDQNYTLMMNELLSEHHNALVVMQTRQAQEMEGPQLQNRTHLFAKHVEEMEIMQATFASDVLQTQTSQRQYYRDFVMELYREYQLRTDVTIPDDASSLSKSSASLVDGKDLVATAASRTWRKEPESSSSSISSTTTTTTGRQRQNSTTSFTSRLSQQSFSSESWKRTSMGPEDLARQKTIQDIQEMGFTKEQAEAAITLTNGLNLERAINLLVESPHQIEQQMQQQHQNKKRSASFTSISNHPSSTSSTSSLHQRQDSWNDTKPNFRRHSLQKPPGSSSSSSSLQQTTKQLSSISSSNAGKSWNPISFLQQQKQAMENTNLSSVRKLGGWLGKAMENLGIEHDENDSPFGNTHGGNTSQLVESFTITLGTAQIKTSHNLRLMVADVAADLMDPLPFDEQRELGYKAQTAMRLYTSQLSAMVVLVEKKELIQRTGELDEQTLDWRLYKTGKGSNHALFERTGRSTEFHFPTLESQLDIIENDLQQRPELIEEGTYFITKHSNLPLHQIVFHLIIDGDAIPNTDLSSRHPLMIGLRNILRLTSRYDVNSLSLPLIMLPDRYLDQPEHYMPATMDQPPQIHTNWLSKRSETLMKTVKGYLMEASRGKQSNHNEMHQRADSSAFGGSGLRNIEFFIPMQQSVYVADPLTTPTTSIMPITTTQSITATTSLPTSPTNMHTPPFPPPHSSSSSSIASLSINSNNNNNNTSTATTNISMHSFGNGATIHTNNNMMTNAGSSSSSLPSTPTGTHYPHYTRMPTPQVEQVFQQLRTLLVNIFRTS